MKQKLLLMADYMASGLWHFDLEGDSPAKTHIVTYYGKDLDTLPITKQTRALMDIWTAWFDTSDDYLVEGGFTMCTKEEFDKLEDIIYTRLGRELSDYEIIRKEEAREERMEYLQTFMVDE